MNRRTLLALAASSTLAGCTTVEGWINGTVNAQAIQTLIADAKSISNGLAAVLPSIAAASGIAPQAAVNILAGLAALQAAADAIAAATDPKAAATVSAVRELAIALNSIVAAAAGVPLLPPEIKLALAAASALLPVLEGLAGIAAAPASSDAATIPPAEAKLILDGFAAGRK